MHAVFTLRRVCWIQWDYVTIVNVYAFCHAFCHPLLAFRLSSLRHRVTCDEVLREHLVRACRADDGLRLSENATPPNKCILKSIKVVSLLDEIGAFQGMYRSQRPRSASEYSDLLEARFELSLQNFDSAFYSS